MSVFWLFTHRTWFLYFERLKTCIRLAYIGQIAPAFSVLCRANDFNQTTYFRRTEAILRVKEDEFLEFVNFVCNSGCIFKGKIPTRENGATSWVLDKNANNAGIINFDFYWHWSQRLYLSLSQRLMKLYSNCNQTDVLGASWHRKQECQQKIH